MDKRDLLKEVYEGRLTDDEADKIYILYMYECGGGGDSWFFELLNLSRIERNAHYAPARWSTIAKWRYEGWPDRCRVCGKPLVLEKWGVRLDDSQGDEWLRHLGCSKKSLRRKLARGGELSRRIEGVFGLVVGGPPVFRLIWDEGEWRYKLTRLAALPKP